MPSSSHSPPQPHSKKIKQKQMDDHRIRVSDYSHSPAHYAVAAANLPALRRLVAALPTLAPPSETLTPAAAAHQSLLAAQISASLDRRDVPGGDTPLHLAVRLSLLPLAALLSSAGADPSLQNHSGWTPLHLSLSLRRPRPLSLLLLRLHRRSALQKLRRRLPSLLSALRGLPDLYLELSFHFESSLLPFLSRAAPSDTYKIWKQSTSIRADTSLAGFDGLKVRRADQSFLFKESDGKDALLVLDRGKKEVRDALEIVDDEAEDEEMVEDASAYRPGVDITKVELVKARNWRGKERVEMVGEWKARVYEMNNVVFSFKTLKAVDGGEDEEEGEMVELELDEEAEEGYIVAEIPREVPGRRSCYEFRDGGGGTEEVGRRRRSVDVVVEREKREWGKVGGRSKEKEVVRNLRPVVWLTEDFPLKTEEFLPLLDILANKVKAVRRLRELLTTKFPPGTFPVKIAIPIVPTVRVVVTFTKYVNLQPSEQFFTPVSSPRHLSATEEEEQRKAECTAHKSSWLKWSKGSTATSKSSAVRSKSVSPSQVVDHVDPFFIPSDYTWVSIKDKSRRLKKSKLRKGKQRETG